MQEHTVAAFFYGSFIRREIMALGGFQPEKIEVARLSGFDIRIAPHASIFRSDQHSIYGILVHPNHEQLAKLYSMDWVGTFLPEAVLVETLDGKLQPALCYIAPLVEPKPSDRDYLDRLIIAGRVYGFPDWYLAKLEGFC